MTTLIVTSSAHGSTREIAERVAEVLRDDFPASPDPRLFRVTLGNLLSMQAGLERQSGRNYGAWVSSRNWVAPMKSYWSGGPT